MAIWIDEHDNETLDDGDVGFLVEKTDSNHGCVSHYILRTQPARTNRSHEPMLTGWCGSYNNVSTDADGLAKVVRRAKNGRLCLARVTPTAALLEELGYPELATDDMAVDAEADSYDRWLTAMQTAGLDLDNATDSTLRRAYAASVALHGS
jgi:hypothetical protein